MTPDGYLSVGPVAAGEVALTLTDGVDGTVVRTSGSTSRDGAATLVVARGQAADGGQLQAVAYASTGPHAYGGPFNPLPVPHVFASPLLTSLAECQAAAETILARITRASGQEWQVEAVPHPALQAGDTVRLVVGDLDVTGTVETMDLPLTAAGGPMSLTVRQS